MNKLKNFPQLLIPILLGIFAFTLITGGKILCPSNINWLLLNVDTADGLYAWQFFRYTPILQSPLGANYPYGMGMGGSVIFAEPLFLFAFPFKLISKLLPTSFQYTGFWILLCFILQAIFSWKLMEKITEDGGLKFLGSIYFILAPPLIWRLHCAPPFLGQWLILAAFLLYFSLYYRHYSWLILLLISSLVHPYLLFMLLALWAADLTQRKIVNELSFVTISKKIFSTGLILALVIWQAGYFMLHSGLETGGLGYFRINLLSFIDTTDGLDFNSWSHILRVQPKIVGEYFEGFVYLGLGMLILGFLGFSKLIELGHLPRSNLKKIAPLLSVSLLLMMYALSNHIALGCYELMHYKLPKIFNIFRASGRMAWPIYYLIYLGVLYLIIKCYQKTTARLLMFICLGIQILDSSSIYNHFRNWLHPSKASVPPLTSTLWIELAKKYNKIIYVFPLSDWKLLPLVQYAAFNKLKINIGYFARVDQKKINEDKIVLRDTLKQGKLDKKAIYIINEKNLRKIIVNTKMNLPYKVSESDGFYLLLPNWSESATKREKINWGNSPYA